MTNPKPLQNLVLRQMLMEGTSNETVIQSVRRFNKSKQTPEDHLQLVSDVRREITRQSKDLRTDETISGFVKELIPFVGQESVLD